MRELLLTIIPGINTAVTCIDPFEIAAVTLCTRSIYYSSMERFSASSPHYQLHVINSNASPQCQGTEKFCGGHLETFPSWRNGPKPTAPNVHGQLLFCFTCRTNTLTIIHRDVSHCLDTLSFPGFQLFQLPVLTLLLTQPALQRLSV